LTWPNGAGCETWNTLDYLAEVGIRYVYDWVNDDHLTSLRSARRAGVIAVFGADQRRADPGRAEQAAEVTHDLLH
jgi:hypothetical protein